MSRKNRNRKQKVREMTIPAFPPVVVVEVDETAEVTESAVAEVAERTDCSGRKEFRHRIAECS